MKMRRRINERMVVVRAMIMGMRMVVVRIKWEKVENVVVRILVMMMKMAVVKPVRVMKSKVIIVKKRSSDSYKNIDYYLINWK
jgi:hypothetical protein